MDLSTYYLELKALHIIFVIFWMAGLLMMPRFFVYHSQCEIGSDEDKKWAEREKRLMRIIMNPGMIITIIIGLALMQSLAGSNGETWLHLKLVFVALMMAVHMMLAKQRRLFSEGTRTKSERYFRLLNEVPSILIIIIIFLVVLKPFMA